LFGVCQNGYAVGVVLKPEGDIVVDLQEQFVHRSQQVHVW